MASIETGVTKGWARGSLWDMTGQAQVITLIGAGGKTTCLRSITQEIDSAGLRVIATTTTKVFPAENIEAWKSPCCPPLKEQRGACFWYAQTEEKNGKWVGPSLNVVDEAIAGDFLSKRYWVIEGDGARGRKLKCWAPHEPQIPMRSDCVVLVLDGDLWGRILQADQVHRPECCPELLGHVWKAERAWPYFLRSPVFALQYQQMSWVILLNYRGENIENEDLVQPLKSLRDLRYRWVEIQQISIDPKNRPRHLRIAAGDAKEGKLQWCDLW
ncbi:MAG TPA: selenium cofactor biosynthesis protein YqeC [Desulfosporosinus sp.]|nr:selenium cofactor biosynthesis protein YqeC [Desulfosporosinus sp.]